MLFFSAMSDFVKCPVWCKRDCKVKHHPLLVALLNCVDTDDEQQIEQQLSDLEHVVLKYEQVGFALFRKNKKKHNWSI